MERPEQTKSRIESNKMKLQDTKQKELEAREELKKLELDSTLSDKEKEIQKKILLFKIQDLNNTTNFLDNQIFMAEQKLINDENSRLFQQNLDKQREEYLKEHIFMPHEWSIINERYRQKVQLQQDQEREIKEQKIYQVNIDLDFKHRKEWQIFNTRIRADLEYLATSKPKKNKLKELFNIRF